MSKVQLPDVETICGFLAHYRKLGTAVNIKGVRKTSDLIYGPPVILVTHEDNMVYCCVWDHTRWSLEEAVEVAKKGERGAVLIEQNVYMGGCLEETKRPTDPDWAQWIDEGFTLQIWPDFTGKREE